LHCSGEWGRKKARKIKSSTGKNDNRKSTYRELSTIRPAKNEAADKKRQQTISPGKESPRKKRHRTTGIRRCKRISHAKGLQHVNKKNLARGCANKQCSNQIRNIETQQQTDRGSKEVVGRENNVASKSTPKKDHNNGSAGKNRQQSNKVGM